MALFRDVYRDPTARMVAEPYSWQGDRSDLFDSLLEAMSVANAVSISGPLVGLPYRVIIAMDEKGKLLEVANPELAVKTVSGTFVPIPAPSPAVPPEYMPFVFSEPCPALTQRSGRPIAIHVIRPGIIRLRGQDRHGELFERILHQQLARLVQHQYDHLNGATLFDRLYDVYQRKLREALGR